ncbi:MAG: META domain-containing protein [Flavobacteriales bacterium]
MITRLRLPLAAIALGLVLSAEKCADNKTAMTSLGNTRWDLRSLAGKAIELPAERRTPYLTLNTDSSEVSGFGGCNTLRGGIKLHGTALSFDQVMSTKMYCENVQPIENGLLDALHKTTGYKLDGNTLTLLGGSQELATLVKHP